VDSKNLNFISVFPLHFIIRKIIIKSERKFQSVVSVSKKLQILIQIFVDFVPFLYDLELIFGKLFYNLELLQIDPSDLFPKLNQLFGKTNERKKRQKWLTSLSVPTPSGTAT